MATYVLRRVLQMIPTLIIMSIITFLVMHAAGNPLDRYLSRPHFGTLNLKALEARYGINQPIYVQYWIWFRGVITGNWGTSVISGIPVLKEIGQRLPATLLLMVSAEIVTMLVAVPLGIYQAIRQYTAQDYTVTVLAFLGISAPTFLVGLVLLLLFAVQWQIFPAGGMITEGMPFTIGDMLDHLVLPMLALATVSIAGYSRYMRSQMLEVVRQDYIRTAQAKGLPSRVVIFKHALRNAVIPIITLLALDVAAFFGGAVITESVFGWPGMGRLFIQAAGDQDYPLLMAILLISGALVVVFNLLVDLAYAWVDPRVTYS